MDLTRLISPLLKLALGAFAFILLATFALYGLSQLGVPGMDTYSSPTQASYAVMDGVTGFFNNTVGEVVSNINVGDSYY